MPARRRPGPVAELLAEAADRPVGGDGARDVDDQPAGLADVERQEVVHRGRRRHRPIRGGTHGEKGAGHGRQQACPALELADAPLVAPVEALLRGRRRRGLVAPFEPPGDAADARIAQRLGHRGETAGREACLGIGQDDGLAAGRRKERRLGRRLAAPRQGEQVDRGSRAA